MKAIKGILVYTLILLAIVFAVAIIAAAVLFFTDVKIFGYGVRSNVQEVGYVTDPDAQVEIPNSIDVTVKTHGLNVVVYPSANNFVTVNYYDSVYGVYKNSKDLYLKGSETITDQGTRAYYSSPRYFDDANQEIIFDGETFEKEIKTTSKSILIEFVEPNDVLLFYGNSRVEIGIPVTTTVGNLKVTTDGGDITVRGSDSGTLNVKSIDFSTKSGNITSIAGISRPEAVGELKIYQFDRFTIDTGKGSCDLSGTDIVLGSISKLPTAIYQATLNDSTFYISSDGGRVVLGRIYGKVNIKGDNINLTADAILTCGESIEVNSNRGILKVDQIKTETSDQYEYSNGDSKVTIHPTRSGHTASGNESVEIYTTYTDIRSKFINGSVSIATTYGNVDIDEAKDYIDVSSTHGDIKVGHAYSNIVLTTDYGDITVGTYDKAALVTTRYGKISLTSSDTNTSETRIRSVDGNVTLRGIIYTLDTKITGKGSCDCVFGQISYNDKPSFTIEASRGDIKAVIDPNVKIPFTIFAQGKSVSGKILNENIQNGVTQKFNSAEGNENNVNFIFKSNEGNVSVNQANMVA